MRSLRHLLADLADAVLVEIETGLLRLGERLLAYAAEIDPTPDFPGDEEEA